jgi:hypothetical protein
MKLDKNLREFIALLNMQGIDFLVVGGHAVASPPPSAAAATKEGSP